MQMIINRERKVLSQDNKCHNINNARVRVRVYAKCKKRKYVIYPIYIL